MPAIPDKPIDDYIRAAAVECRNTALLRRHLEHIDSTVLELIKSESDSDFQDGLNLLCALPFWTRHYTNPVAVAFRLRHYLQSGRVIYPQEILAGLESPLLERAFQSTPNDSESET